MIHGEVISSATESFFCPLSTIFYMYLDTKGGFLYGFNPGPGEQERDLSFWLGIEAEKFYE